jgi:hypothetical protein
VKQRGLEIQVRTDLDREAIPGPLWHEGPRDEHGVLIDPDGWNVPN